jgi:hypothetical protein
VGRLQTANCPRDKNTRKRQLFNVIFPRPGIPGTINTDGDNCAETMTPARASLAHTVDRCWTTESRAGGLSIYASRCRQRLTHSTMAAAIIARVVAYVLAHRRRMRKLIIMAVSQARNNKSISE